jgi:hypothetical protein
VNSDLFHIYACLLFILQLSISTVLIIYNLASCDTTISSSNFENVNSINQSVQCVQPNVDNEIILIALPLSLSSTLIIHMKSVSDVKFIQVGLIYQYSTISIIR